MSNPPTPDDPAQIAGRYQIVGRLGAGAFGTVYKAKDKILGRMIAIKTIRFEGLAATSEGRDELMRRFRREAQVSAQLRHPNIVTIYDVGEDAGLSYLAMEFIDGVGLDRVIHGHGALAFERAASIAAQVADALDYAQRSGVVHRDIKPANVMIEDGDRVKVADFGIAKSMNSLENLTMTGGLLGTPSYMSPEQARGGAIDGRTDLFALGCILYEMLAGRKAFTGDSVTALIFKILSEDPEPLPHIVPGIPGEIVRIVETALRKDAAQRYQTGREMADDLKALTQPGFTPTLRQREMPTTPVGTITGEETSPAYTPRTVPPPEPTSGPPDVPATAIGAPPSHSFRQAEELAPPPIPRMRRGSGFALIAGLGVAVLLLFGVAGFAVWRLLVPETKTAEVVAQPSPTAIPSAAVVEPSARTARAPAMETPGTAAPSTNETAATRPPEPATTATAPPHTRPASPPSNVPAETRVVQATPAPQPREVVPPAAVEDLSRDITGPTELDREPAEVIDGSEAGRRVAEAFRSGSSGGYRAPLRARSPIPEGLDPLEQRVAVNLYNLSRLQEEFRRREGRYAELGDLLAWRRLSGWSPRGYRLEARVDAGSFEIVAEPQRSGLRRLAVDDTRFVRVN